MVGTSVVPDDKIAVTGPADSGLQIVRVDERLVDKALDLLALDSAQAIDVGKVVADGKTLFQPVTGLVRTMGWVLWRSSPMFSGAPRLSV